VAYVALYRKYRSQTFAEVVGQDHVTTTLARAVDEGRWHHAYLFTGPRGTGKTSTARILAKSLNCLAGPTSAPDNTCPHCVAITEGSSIDVIEIDAASHGGVDDVRDLRERVAFAPASARTKVYIVDECHMLSTAGWNAFLKTVEEPPGHVVFVFATTEPHKVLPTILSRTQRFDFRRIAGDVLAAHVQDLGRREGFTFEPGAVDLIVRAGDGSARDTLSVLDQVAAYEGTAITLRGCAEVLGTVPDELLMEAADGIAAGDVAGLCVLVQRLADQGVDLRQFARDAVEHLRALLLLAAAPDAGLVDTTPERLERLTAQAGRLGRVELLRAVDLLAEAQVQMRRGNTRLPLEVALVKAALPEASGDPAALAARMDRLERRTGLHPDIAPHPAPTAPPAAPTPTAPAPTAQPSAARAPAPTAQPSAARASAPAAQAPTAPARGSAAQAPTAPASGSAAQASIAPAPAPGSAAAPGSGSAPGSAPAPGSASSAPAPADPAPAAPNAAASDPAPGGSPTSDGGGEADGAGTGKAGAARSPRGRAAAPAKGRAGAQGSPPTRDAAPPPAEPPADDHVTEPAEALPPPAAAPAEPTAVAAAVDLDLVRSSWPAVLEALKARRRTLHALLNEGHPTALEGNVLTVTFDARHGFHAGEVARDDWIPLFGDVFRELFGSALRVRALLGEAPPVTAAPDPVRADPAAVREADDVAESEAAARAGEVTDDDTARDLAIATLQRHLGATVVDDGV